MLRWGAVFPATLARGCVPHKRRGPLESCAYKNQVNGVLFPSKVLLEKVIYSLCFAISCAAVAGGIMQEEAVLRSVGLSCIENWHFCM